MNAQERTEAIAAGLLTEWHCGDNKTATTPTPKWPAIVKTIVFTRERKRLPECVVELDVLEGRLDLDGRRYAFRVTVTDTTTEEQAREIVTSRLRVAYAGSHLPGCKGTP